MSHFCVLVILPLGTQRRDVVAVVGRFLEPFALIPTPASMRFFRFKDVEEEQLRNYESKTRTLMRLPDGTLVYPFDEQFRNPDLKSEKHFIYPAGSVQVEVPFRNLYKSFTECMDQYCGCEAPDERTGRYGRWENPNGKFDFWQIGGRWTGALVRDYDPETDARNLAPCESCSGTGRHPDSEPVVICSHCGGSGQNLKWPLDWAPFEGDTQVVKEINPDFLTHAYLTPDGSWYSVLDSECIDTKSSESEIERWSQISRKIMEAHSNHFATVVDCHL